ncbi:NUDIX hydrolase [Pseudonocardia alni subsp. carboxydivorans]|uniref:NUDIX hydrolase n=1 Tax=Pseudonocardia alni subsp. carboxydivorans TaxID=415010 RepID=A0ABU9AC64_PSEA5
MESSESLPRTTKRGERTVYDSEWLRVGLADIEPPDGRRFEHHVVHMKPVSIAVLVDDSDRALMLHRHRWVTDEIGYEFLGGLIEPGEDPADTARREAEEESGWRPSGPPQHLASFQPLPGMVDSLTHIYLWRSFDHVGEPSDLEEAGLLEWVPLPELPALVAGNRLLGAGTLIAALQLLARQAGVEFTPGDE